MYIDIDRYRRSSQSLTTRYAVQLVQYQLDPASTRLITRLDYCNSILTGLPKEVYAESLQNAAARLVPGLQPRDHIKPALSELYTGCQSTKGSNTSCVWCILLRFWSFRAVKKHFDPLSFSDATWEYTRESQKIQPIYRFRSAIAFGGRFCYLFI